MERIVANKIGLLNHLYSNNILANAQHGFVMLCFGIDLLTVACADIFCIPDICVIIVVIFYFFLEPAMMGLCPSGFQPPMANKYCCCLLNAVLHAQICWNVSTIGRCVYSHVNKLLYCIIYRL